ncbi:MAG: flagellar M-ring protein FliF [Treponema sp.]|nr:flagellar M-ring protein FliF [Treponema sp.]
MNEWLKKVGAKIKELWSKWKPIQKVIIIGIILVVIVVIIVTARLSGKPSSVRLFNDKVSDTTTRTQILTRLDQAGIEATTDNDGYIYVENKDVKRQAVILLNDDNLLPSNIDIWSDYFDRSWSTTDADQNVKLKEKKRLEIERFIESYPDIYDATVTIEMPDNTLFSETQNPVTCSVILKTKSGSTLLTDRKRILGIQKAVLAGIEGLKEDYLIITDEEGNQINDFAGMADSDAVDIVSKQQKLILRRETEIRAKILDAFRKTYTTDRCRDVLVSVDMDMSKKTSESKVYSGIEMKKDNPDTPWDDSEYRDYLPISQQTVTKVWKGTGYNPEGPAGTEGENPPVYSDMTNVVGESSETGLTQNNALNEKTTQEITSPKIDRVTVSVNIDGTWSLVRNKETGKYELDDEGWRKREYKSLTPYEISEAEKVVKGAIGYNRDRGDQVYVTNIAYDRRDEQHAEDLLYFAKEKRTIVIICILAGIVFFLIAFILFRVISKEIERRRREREAKLLAEQQAARERALWDAKDDGMEVTMSVEETRRMELQENAITMAKEHPEDVAMLIRTWLMEE